MTTIYLWLLGGGLAVLVLAIIVDMIVTLAVKSEHKIYDIICYVIGALAGLALFGAAAIHVVAREEVSSFWSTKFFSINRWGQARWIRENLTDDLWNMEVQYRLVEEYVRIDSVLMERAAEASKQYADEVVQEIENSRNAMYLFGLGEFYDLLGGGENKSAEVSARVDRYFNHLEAMTDQLADDFKQAYEELDSLKGQPGKLYSDQELFKYLVGTPRNTVSLSSSKHLEIVRNIATCLVNDTPPQAIVSLEYDKDLKCWFLETLKRSYSVRLEGLSSDTIQYTIDPL